MDTKKVALIGAGAVLLLMMGGKKSSAKSSGTGGTGNGSGSGTGEEIDVDVDVEPNNGGGGQKPQDGGGGGQPNIDPNIKPEKISDYEKKYVDFYYNLGMYKLQKLDTKEFGVPENLASKGTKTDAQWLANISYWAAYAAPNNEYGSKAPWQIPKTGAENKAWSPVWLRIYNYAKTLLPEPKK